MIKYRQAVMKAIGGHTGAIVAVVKGEVSYVGQVARAPAADAVLRIGADVGSGKGAERRPALGRTARGALR